MVDTQSSNLKKQAYVNNKLARVSLTSILPDLM